MAVGNRFQNTTRGREAREALEAQLTEVTVTGTRRAIDLKPAAETIESLGRVSFSTSSFKREEGLGDSINDLAFPDRLHNGNLPFIKFDVFEINTNSPDATTVKTRSAASLTAGFSQAASAVSGAAQAAVASASELAGKIITQDVKNISTAIGSVVSDVAGEPDINGLKSKIAGIFTDFSLNRYSDTRTASIALPIPEGVQTQYAQDYGDISMTSAFGLTGFAAQALAEPKFMQKNDPYLTELATRLASGVLGSSEDLTNLINFGATGRVINPQLEMLYRSPLFREFVFDFRLVPRSRDDARRISDIVRNFKYYSSPSFCGTTTGRYYVPPAKIAFTFFNSEGNFNDALFRSKQCVITNLSVDYAPNGYATHDDDYPVETRMQLTLRETAMITREDINEDNY